MLNELPSKIGLALRKARTRGTEKPYNARKLSFWVGNFGSFGQ